MDLVRSLLPPRPNTSQSAMNPENSSAKQALEGQLEDTHGRPPLLGPRSNPPPCDPRNQQMQADSFHGKQGSARGNFGGRSANRGGRNRGYKRPKAYLEVLEPPRTHGNPFGFMNVKSDRPIPLTADHPLKEELAEVKRERELRKKYWAGLAQRIPEEMENPGSYDFQRWQEEEKMADAKVEELAGLIALAERGIPIMREESKSEVRDRQQNHSQPQSQGLEGAGGKRKRVRTKTGRNGRPPKQDCHEQDFTAVQVHRGSHKTRYQSARASDTVACTDTVRSKAVAKWMRDMGASIEDEKELSEIQFLIGRDGKSISSSSDENMDSDNDIHAQQHDNGATIQGNGVSEEQLKRPFREIMPSQAAWTAEEEAAFEEAETRREAERVELAMCTDTMMIEPSSQGHLATITEVAVTTDPRLRRNDKVVGKETTSTQVAALPEPSQAAQAIHTTKQSTPREKPIYSVDPQKALCNLPSSLPSTALHYISPPGTSVVEGNRSQEDKEKARKSSELLAALLEELNRSSESPSPPPELQPTSGSPPNHLVSAATVQSLPSLSCKQGTDNDMNKPFREKRTDASETPADPKRPLKIVDHILSNTYTVPKVESPSPCLETSMPHAKSSVISEKQRAMAAAVLKRVQAQKLRQDVSQQPGMAMEQRPTVSAIVPSKTFTPHPSSDSSMALETSEQSQTVRGNGKQNRPKASDYMDLDEVDIIDVVDMHDGSESVSSTKNPMEIDSSSCSGNEEEGSYSESDGDVRLGSNVVQQGRVHGRHIESAESIMPPAPPPLAGRVLYMGNLSFEATEEDLREVLDDYQV